MATLPRPDRDPALNPVSAAVPTPDPARASASGGVHAFHATSTGAHRSKALAFAVLVASFCALAVVFNTEAHAAKKTVCTITVNSPDEKETFRASLPADQYEFVELVERGRPNWLESACRQGVRCDMLVISGHYDGGNEFFSDKIEAREYLPVDEMERVSCSDSCPGLFSNLKEVYLFGCNTLNASAVKSASAEISRSLVRSGHSKTDAERIARALGTRHAESSRDRMRLIFPEVPVIYGFSSVAPLGPQAAATLRAHFRAAGTAEVATGRASARLLGRFASNSMVVTSGMKDTDPQAAHRSDVCQFADDRLSPAQKTDFVHELFNREAAEARMFLERIERNAALLPEVPARPPALSAALERIAHDDKARSHFLALARDADEAPVRARMIDVAHQFGWLDDHERRVELVRVIADRLASNGLTSADVDLACTLNKDGALEQASSRDLPPASPGNVAHAAVLACMGSVDDRTRVLQALTSHDEASVQMAQVFLRHRPLADVAELREVTTGIGRMSAPAAKMRALEALARHQLSDREALEILARQFPYAESAGVQTAIAGVLIRSDYAALDKPELLQTIREHRIKPAEGADLVDVLIRRLQAP
jgi:hypothetical protein